MSIIVFILILLILILVHEYGHFIVAKKSGIRVDEFGIGFPPRALKLFTRKGTLFSLNWIPFGGFVKIFGENPDDESLHGPDAGRALVNKPRGIQALVLIAGILFNILLAWVLLSVAFMIGLEASSSAFNKDLVNNPMLTMTQVSEGTPADIAGLQAGDKIDSISYLGETISDPTPELFQEFVHTHGDLPITLGIIRNDEPLDILVTPVISEGGTVPMIGVSLDEVGTLKLPFFKSFIFGAKTTINETTAIVKAFGNLLGGAATGNADLSDVAGPVGIVGLVKLALNLGFAYLLYFTALISINLAVINLFPFPALDGGRLLFLLIEAIRGKRLNQKFANYANGIGFLLLIGLMIVITIHDVIKLF
jgi:regulator of sigma E protease